MRGVQMVVLACCLLSTPLARAQDVESKAVHYTIRTFITALLNGDTPTAQEACVNGAKFKTLIEAMAAGYLAQHEYCDAFKQLTGFNPSVGLSIKRAMDENLDGYSVDFHNDVAHSLWGDYSLRKVGGKWKIEFAEYDFDLALTERLELLRSRPEMYKAAMAKLKTEGETRWWVVESQFASIREDFEKKYKELLTKVDDLCVERTKVGVQGAWQVTVEPSMGEHPLWKVFTAKLTITGNELRIDAPISALKKTDRLSCSGVEIKSSINGIGIEQEWSMRYVRILGQLRGTLVHQHDDEIDVYRVVGIPIK